MHRLVVLLLVLPWPVQAADAQPKAKKAEGIDARTVAAYEKLGARYGGAVKTGSLTSVSLQHFEAGKEAATKGLPGFRVSPLADGKFPHLPKVSVPFALDLGGMQVTDAGLKELAGLKNLSFLDLRSTKVTDAGLEHLARLKNLSHLSLSVTQVTDAGLKHLAGLKNLSFLDLGSTPVTSAGLEHLAGLKNLSYLVLNGTKVTDAGVKHLAGLNGLSTLDLVGTKVTDAGLKELVGLKNLSTLTLGATEVTDAGLKHLVGLKKLSTLDLSFTQVTDAGVKHLAGLNGLSTLDLVGTKVTDVGAKELAGLKNLSYLDLVGTKVTDAGLKHLVGLKKHSTLDLRGTKLTLTYAVVKKLQQALPGCRIFVDAKPGTKFYKTPQLCFDAFSVAAQKNDWRTFIGCLTPEDQRKVAATCAHQGCRDYYKVQGTDAAKKYKALFDVMNRHGLTAKAIKDLPATLLSPNISEEEEGEYLKLIKEPATFASEFMLEKEKVEPTPNPSKDQPKPKLTDVKIDGKEATATSVTSRGKGAEAKESTESVVVFKKIGGGWRISLLFP
jgi:hypothetical protein